jgi:CheY-like chemotaxis protein
MTEENANKKLIMIAEDDAFIGDIYEMKLKGAGYEVVLASNGRDAIEKLEDGVRPNIMLLDIVMPYMDGFDVLEAMTQRDEWKDIPVVLLTNLSQKEDVEKGMSLGAKDYLIKSHFTPTEVLKKVEKYIS